MSALPVVLLAVLWFAGVGAIAAVHALWRPGSHWPEEREELLMRGVVGDGRRRMPAGRQCFAVGPFATRNRRYYSPLCLLLGAGHVAQVAGAIGP
jgi:hypothetical protein